MRFARTLQVRRIGITAYAIRRSEDGAAPGHYVDRRTSTAPRAFVVDVPEAGQRGVGVQARIRGVDVGVSIWRRA